LDFSDQKSLAESLYKILETGNKELESFKDLEKLQGLFEDFEGVLSGAGGTTLHFMLEEHRNEVPYLFAFLCSSRTTF
jgi:hypothetical protein